MANGKIQFNVAMNLDQKGVNDILNQIKAVQKNMKLSFDLKNDKQAMEAFRNLDKLADSLKLSINEAMGVTSVKQFDTNMKKLGITVEGVKDSLEEVGVEGSIAFGKLNKQVQVSTQYFVKQESAMSKMVAGFGKTAAWSMMNRGFDMITNSIQDAVSFTKNLDKSLNDIRIVTGKTAEEMTAFSQVANETATALGQTTIAYTEGALLFLQQGKTMAEAAELTKATLVGANITGEDTAEMANLLTAALNGYNLAANDAMTVTDKFAAVGAATGSDFNELATAFSKTASMASVAGVSFDQLTAQIATIATVTREAPESIGTSLKTIFGRMTEIKELGSDEEGTSFGKVKETMDAVGISIVEANGQLKNMGEVIEEVGNQWVDFDKNTQVAIANALAGSRQANRLLALFQNWEMYQGAVETSTEAAGAAMEQNAIYMDSLQAKSKELRTAIEELYMAMVDNTSVKALFDVLTNGVEILGNMMDSVGGIIPLLALMAPALKKAFDPMIMESFSRKAMTSVQQMGLEHVSVEFDNLNQTMKENSNEAVAFLKNMKVPEDVINSYQELIAIEQELGAKQQAAIATNELMQKYDKEKITTYEQLKKTVNDNLMAQSREIVQLTKNKRSWEELLATVDKADPIYNEIEAEIAELDGLMSKAKKTSSELAAEQNKLAVEIHMTEQEFKQAADSAKVFDASLEQAQNKTKAFQGSLQKFSEGLGQKIAKMASSGLSLFVVFTSLIGAFKDLKTAAEEGTGSLENTMETIGGTMSSIGMGLMFMGPTGALIGGIMLAVGGLIQLADAFDLFDSAAEKSTKKAEALNKEMSKFNDSESGIRNTTRAIEDFNKAMSENPAMSTEEQTRKFQELNKTIAEAYPGLVKYIDELGNPVVGENLDEIQNKLNNFNDASEAHLEKSRESVNKTRQDYIDSMVDTVRQSADYQATMSDVNQGIVQSFYSLNKGFKELPNSMKGVVSGIYDAEKAMKILEASGASGINAYEANVSMMIESLNKISENEEFKNKFSQLDAQNKELLISLVSSQASSVEEAHQMLIDVLSTMGDADTYLDTDMLKEKFSKAFDIEKSFEQAQDAINGLFYGNDTAILDFWNTFSKNGVLALEQLNEQLSKMSVEDQLSSLQGSGVITAETSLEIGALDEEEARKRIVDIITNQLVLTENLTEEQQKLINLIDEQKAKAEATAAFREDYENPYVLSDEDYNNELDKVRTLYDENEKLIEMLNDAEVRLFDEEGNEYAEKFTDLVDRANESTEDYMETMSGLTQVFGELSEKDLKEAFGADIANSLSEIFDVMRSENPLEQLTEQSKEMVDGVLGNFKTLEDEITEHYLRIKGQDAEFYQQLIKGNEDYFGWYKTNLDINAGEYSTYADFKAAVDEWYYTTLNGMDEQSVNYLLDNKEHLLTAEQLKAIAELDANEQKDFLIRNMDKEAAVQFLENQKAQLQARKEELIAEVKATGSANDSMDDSNQALAQNAYGYFQTVMRNVSATGALEGTGISNLSGASVIKTVDTAVKNLNEIAAIDSALGQIEGLLGALEGPTGPDGKIDLDIPKFERPTSPGGVSKPSTGKKPSSSKDKKEKEQEDLEIKKDLYHDINIELKKQNDLLKKLEDAEDDTFGQARINNLNAQADALRKIRDLSEQKLAIARQEAKDLQSTLGKSGVKFDESGAITNYNDIIQSKLAAANAITDADAKKQAQEAVKTLQKAMDEYDKLQFDVIFDYENELEELRESIQEKILEAIEYKYETKIKVTVDFQEEMDFFNEIMGEHEGADKGIERAIKSFASQFTVLEDLDAQFQEILNNTELDAATKAEKLDELKKQIMDATLDLKDLRDAISDMIQNAIGENVDAVYDLVDSFKNVNSEIDDYLKMYELLRKTANVEEINNMLDIQADSNRGQIELLKKSKKELESLRDSLEEGTDEWKLANEQIEKMDKDIRKLAQETIKIYQDQLENIFNKTIKDMEKALSGGLGFDKLEREIEESRKEQEKYFDITEKIVWGSKMQKKIQEDINKATDPKKRAELQKFYDKEVVSMLEKDKLTASEVKRAELLYDLTLKQMAVEEARANKTIMRLVRDDQGNWTYQYMADISKVAEAQENLSSSVEDLLAHDRDAYERTQDEILDRRKQFISDMSALFEAYQSGEIATKEEFDALAKQLEEDFNNDMFQLSSEYAQNEKNLAESTLGSITTAYGTAYGTLDGLTDEQKKTFIQMGIDVSNGWDGAIGSMIESNSDLSESFKGDKGVEASIKDSIANMSDAMGDYEKKVASVAKKAGVDLGSIGKNTDALKGKVENLNTKANDLVTTMGAEFTAIGKLLPEYDKLKTKYDNLATSINTYVTNLKNAITEQQKLANTPTPSTPTTPPSSGGSSGSSSSSSSSSSKADPGQGSAVKPKPGTRWYYDSAGKNPSGNAWQQDLIVTKKAGSGSHPYNLGRKSGEYLGWMKKTDLVGYKSGGFTGDWSASGGPDGMGGRLALLHQKELVLNREDTQNILDAVGLVREYAQSLKVPEINLPGQESGAIQQTVQINADFSGVKNSNEIEKAFDNLVNKAVQYTKQIKG